MHIEETVSKPPAGNGPWSKLMAMRVGPLPLPLYLSLAAIAVAAAIAHRLPNDLIGGLAVMMLSGFLLGELGKRIPVLKHIGGSAILCLFVPSALLGYKLFDPDMLKALAMAMKTANLQYLYIACLVVGSILGMNHKVLVQGFLRMFIPLLVGTLGASPPACLSAYCPATPLGTPSSTSSFPFWAVASARAFCRSPSAIPK